MKISFQKTKVKLGKKSKRSRMQERLGNGQSLGIGKLLLEIESQGQVINRDLHHSGSSSGISMAFHVVKVLC